MAQVKTAGVTHIRPHTANSLDRKSGAVGPVLGPHTLAFSLIRLIAGNNHNHGRGRGREEKCHDDDE